MTVTRFAPSPNGPLHWGHAYSAIVAHDLARQAGGRFLLRIEDIDGPRSRPELADEFRRDLEWLGLEWEEVPAQGTRGASYILAAQRLRDAGLLYPCTCTRAEVAEAASTIGPEGPVYPGTCRGRSDVGEEGGAWRLDVRRALDLTGPLTWHDALAGEQAADPLSIGDPVLVRKDLPASYHLAVTLDDAADGVTLVMRGRDLFAATHVHRLLQAVLGLPVPRWHHHALLLDEDGRKLAKRRRSKALSDHREAGENGLAWAEKVRMGKWPCGNRLEKD
ncbi:tRNA glutamyl-Q(34) synthetase GluQRS [Altererythrobacter sp. MTPC7]|uniref:tRNA glutamyl-Q(34) synthetase GluQRS n=1 Tax=Altererythrobacter sp. MTPC7 TaxID=3056567 RepID=UPI0036F43E9C